MKQEGFPMEPIREADVQTQPGKRLAEKTEKRGSKRPWMIAVIIAAVLVAAYLACALRRLSRYLLPQPPYQRH